MVFGAGEAQTETRHSDHRTMRNICLCKFIISAYASPKTFMDSTNHYLAPEQIKFTLRRCRIIGF